MTRVDGPLIRPFAGLRPAPKRGAEVAAPPYDVMNTSEARELARGKPHSFLHVSRAEIDLNESIDPYDDSVYATAAQNLKRMLSDEVLLQDAEPHYYIYRISTPNHVQTGLACAASVDAYLDNRIRKHELTRPNKETDRVKQIEAVGAITGPVMLVHRHDPRLSELFDSICERNADVVVPELDGARHELWATSDPDKLTEIDQHFAAMTSLYIADGHHRSAAAARVAAAKRESNPDYSGDEAFNGFLAVSFPHNEVQILDYNRVVTDLNGKSPGQMLMALEPEYSLTVMRNAVRPDGPQQFGMYLDGRWYVLKPRAAFQVSDPVDALDVSLLEKKILTPLLGIADQRTDKRIDFVGGSRGPEAIAARVDSGEMAIGFTLYPTALEDLMSVADADKIMPPKSTWFEPKLADGIISLPL